METLSELVVKIKADSSELKKGLTDAEGKTETSARSMQDSLKKIGTAMTAVGAAITAVMAVAVKSFTNVGTELLELSQKTGISVESLSELKYVGKMAGVSLDTLAVAVRSMSSFMETARDGGEAATKTFTKLGLNFKDLRNLQPEQLFMKLSSAVASVKDPMQRAALAVDVFGRSGMNLIPMFADGADGIAKLRTKAQELGITMSTETATSADDLGDALDTVKESVGGVFNAIGSSLAPMITSLTDKITKVISGVTNWSKEHPELARTLSLVTIGVGGVLTVLGIMLLLLPKIIAIVGVAKVAFISFNAAMGPVGWAIAGISVALGIALPFIIDSTKETVKLTAAERDLATQTTRTNLQLKLGAESWGYLTARAEMSIDQFDPIAIAHNMTTKELYAEVRAANMIQDVWGGKEGMIYLKNLKDIEKGLDKVTEASDEATAAQIENLRNLVNEAKRRSNESTQDQIAGINKVMSAKSKAHTIEMSELDDTYQGLIKNINTQLGIVIDGYQSQIDAIDKQTSEEEEALTKQNEQKRLGELVAAGDYKAYAEYLTEVQRNELLRQREDQKDALRLMMDEARKKAETQKDLAETEYNNTKANLVKTYDALVENLDLQKTALEDALKVKLALYDADLAAFDENLKLQLLSLQDFITKYNAALADLGAKTVVANPPVATVPTTTTTPTTTPDATGKPTFGEVWKYPEYPYTVLGQGGIVTSPTMALVGESGAEAVVPLEDYGSGMTVNLNFTEPVFFDREDQMNTFVSKIGKVLDRQWRLRFGGGYSGS